MKVHDPFKSELLKDSETVMEALFDCIRHDDVDNFRIVLAAYLMTVNKTKLAKKAGIGRRTLYDIIDFDKEFNPEFTTISALMKALAA